MITMMDFKRQNKIFDPSKQQSNITIIGVGSIGSFITLTLAKLGFNKIHVFDKDIVEEHNLPNQFYRHSDIGKPKVVALKEMVKDFTGVDIIAHDEFIEDPINQISIDGNMIIVYALDSIKVRKDITDKLIDYPLLTLIDARMGGEGWQIHVVDFSVDEERERYYQTLLGKPKHLPCGAKSIIYTILSVSSEVARIVKQIDMDEPTAKVIKREMNNYRFISG